MRDLAIDLGTCTSVVRARGRGVLVREPALVAIDERTGDVLAFGEAARGILGQAGHQAVESWPMRRGAVTDFHVTDRIFRSLFRRAGASKVIKPRLLLAVPSVLTSVEQRALEDAAYAAGARSVMLIKAPLAAAIGAGLPIEEPHGTCVVDIGGGLTECVVLSLGGIVSSRMLKIGGFDMDEAIQRWFRREYDMSIGDRAAEELKIAIGAALRPDDDEKAEVRGRDLSTGAPKAVIVGADEVCASLDEPLGAIIAAVRATLAETPPDLAHDVLVRGIALCGGTAQLPGLAERITAETSIPVHVVEDPAGTVALGAERALGALAQLVRAGAVIQA